MNYPEKIQELLQGFKASKGVRSLTLEEQSVLKVAVIMRNDTVIDLMERLLKEEKSGQAIDLSHLKGVIEDFGGKHEGKQISELREATARKEEDKYLNDLMNQVNG